MRKIWDIHGGVHPPENKTQSNRSPIATIRLPKEIILPLNQHIGAPAQPIVSVGERVLKGQKIADAQGFVSAPVHASTSGKVSDIGDRVIPHSSGMTAPCITIQPDNQEEWVEVYPCEDYTKLERTELLERIREAGIAGMGGAGFPSAVKLNPAKESEVDTLILNGTECEPYITADDVLMRERADQIIEGAKLLAHILHNPKNILIGIEDNKPEAIQTMQKAAQGTNVEIVSFPTKYPSGGEKQLIQILTGKEVPSGKLPANVGIVVQNIGTAVAAYRAVKFGEPLISRVTTVVGESLTTQRNIDVLLGTPIEHVLQEHGFNPNNSERLIIGGPMMGFAVEQTSIPVIKTTNCILAPSKDEMPEQPPAQPCIRCGMCAEACPASLLPQQLFWYSQAEEFEKLQSHQLFDCIECGACSFVCPSNIPLVQYYRHSKATIRQIEKEKVKSDRSRQRFEFRKERLAKVEAEKEAKRIARKKAAEEAKKKAAAKAKVDEGQQADGEQTKQSTDPVAAAITKAQQKAASVTPEQQKAKLERAVAGAQNRLDRAKEQLAAAEQEGNTERVESLQAKLKQAELKHQEANDKLKAFATDASAPSATETTIKDKLASSPTDILKQKITTLESRINVAKQKLAEAEAENSNTVEALRKGVEKLETKHQEAQKELSALPESNENTTSESPAVEPETLSAAEQAIAKAKQKAAMQASMSDEEKAQAQKASLEARLDKAKARLQKAIDENNENVDAFRLGVEKIEAKLKDL